MPPQGQQVETFQMSSGISYPKNRDHPFRSPDLWLQDKRQDDGAEGLWRIHNELYDLTDWIERHPGGRDWIRLTQGTDITEQFESHHLTTQAEKLLPKFHIRSAKVPRNAPYTFLAAGFYRTLKKRICTTLETVPDYPVTRSKIMTDLLLLSYVATAVVSVITWSFMCGALSGLLLHLTTVAAHNYFHQKDSFRMYYFDLSFLSSREWRISHAMSHHIYTNTINDLEISLVEPFLLYLPEPKSILRRIMSCIISPALYATMFVFSFVKRLFFAAELNKTEFIPFLVPVIMYFVSGRSILETAIMFLWIVTNGSFIFGLMGVSAAHHHPEIYHEGDTTRKDRDWGLSQLDAVMDRAEITGSHFMVLTGFGDHALHHMFPTVDHGKLAYLYPALKKTCKEFGVTFRMTSQLDLFWGQFVQLFRTTPNPFPPGQKWDWYNPLSIKFTNKSI